MFLFMFWAFNVLMAVSMFVSMGTGGDRYDLLASDAARAGYAAGTVIWVILLLFIWAAGALILGMLVMATRGRKVITEETA